jgi:hypothetical protein
MEYLVKDPRIARAIRGGRKNERRIPHVFSVSNCDHGPSENQARPEWGELQSAIKIAANRVRAQEKTQPTRMLTTGSRVLTFVIFSQLANDAEQNSEKME